MIEGLPEYMTSNDIEALFQRFGRLVHAVAVAVTETALTVDELCSLEKY